MLRSFFLNKKWLWWSWGGGLLLALSLLIQVTITVKINQWYKGFYDVLQKPMDFQVSDQKIDSLPKMKRWKMMPGIISTHWIGPNL